MNISCFSSRAVFIFVFLTAPVFASAVPSFGQQIADLLNTKNLRRTGFTTQQREIQTPVKRIDASKIEIRQARIEELENIIALDYATSMEFFKPMFEQHYTGTIMAQQAEKLLTEETKITDRISFSNAIQSNDNKQKLVIAYDANTATYCGLLFSEQIDDKTIEILLLLVDKNYRNCGIGKKLIKETLSIFTGVTRCEVYPFQRGNESTLLFYEKVGFKRTGKGPADQLNHYGISYDKLYFEYILDEAGIKQLLKNK